VGALAKGAAALALWVPAAVAAQASGRPAPARVVLSVVADAAPADPWPARLEGLLDESGSGRGWAVVERPLSLGAAPAVLLARFSPDWVVSRGPLPPAAVEAARKAGVATLELPTAPLAAAQALLRAAGETAAPRAAAARAAAARDSLRAHEALRDDDGLEDAADRVLAAAASDPEALRALAALQARQSRLRGQKRLRDALLTLDKLLAAAPARAAARAFGLKERGRLRALIGDFDGARADLEAALRLVPGDGEAALLLAQAERETPERALRWALRAARPGSGGGRAAALLAADISLDLGDERGARRLAAKALEAYGEDPDALRLMARLSRGEPAEARGYAERAEQAALALPDWLRPAALRFCARLWQDLGETGRALSALGAAHAAAPEDTAAMEELARLRREQPGAAAGPALAAPAAAPAESRSAVELRVSRDPDALPDLFRLEELAFSEGRVADAAALAARLQETIHRAPLWTQFPAYLRASSVWQALGDPGRARECLLPAKDLEPDSPEANLALYPLGRRGPDEQVLFERATRFYQEADPANEDLRDAWRRIARGHAALDEPQAARAALERARALAPGDTETVSLAAELDAAEAAAAKSRAQRAALEREAEAALAAGKAAAALTAAQSLCAMPAPGPAEEARALALRARAQRANNDPAAAFESLERALALSPSEPGLLEAAVRCAWALGRGDRALELARRLTAARAGAPAADAAAAWDLRAQAEEKVGDRGAEAGSLQRALRLSPGEPARLAALAAAYRALGRDRDALEAEDQRAAALSGASADERAKAAADRAGTLAGLGDDDAAAKALDEALALRLSDTALRAALIQERSGFLEHAAAKSAAAGDDTAAERALRRALELAPARPQTLEALADLAARGQRPAEALELARRLERALETADAPALRRAAASDRLAELLAARGERRAARKAFERALAAAPSDARALRALGDPAAGLLDARAALPYADRLVASAARLGSPAERADALQRRAAARAALGDAAGAEADRRAAAAAAPEDLASLWPLLSEEKLPADALALVDARKPAGGRALGAWRVLRGQARARLGDAAGAREEFEAAVAQDADAACFGDLAERERGSVDAAYFDACLARFQDRPELYLNRGVARFRAGRAGDAEADFRRALELRPAYTEAGLSLAYALAAAGRRDEALAALDRSQSLAADRGSAAYAGLLELRRGLRRAR
jgi:tetratricopeptide (TPR) repeat protein